MSNLAHAVAVAMAAALGATSAASAFEPTQVTDRIFYGDLNLSTPTGAQAMLRRIQVSVDRLCTPTPSPLLRRGFSPRDIAQCRPDAMQQAVAQLDAPMVTAAYEQVRPSMFAAR